MVVVAVGTTLMSSLDQLWMLALALPLQLYGPVNAALLGSLALGGLLAGRWRGSSGGSVRCALIVLLGSWGLLFANSISVVVAQCVTLGGFTLLSISLGQRLHAATPSDVRSTTSSAVATVGTLCFAPVALVFGRVSEISGVFRAAWIAVALAALALIGTAVVQRWYSPTS
jgi:hypothetical protein